MYAIRSYYDRLGEDDADAGEAVQCRLDLRGQVGLAFGPGPLAAGMEGHEDVGQLRPHRIGGHLGAPQPEDVLQMGRKQVAAGYILYGSSTMLVYTTGYGVHGFTYEPRITSYNVCYTKLLRRSIDEHHSPSAHAMASRYSSRLPAE